MSNERSNITELARELGIRVSMLYKWREDYYKFGAGSFPGNGKVILSETEQELPRLRKELRETQLERDILKKAVGIFSRSDGKYSGS